jgi:hypothetical protein
MPQPPDDAGKCLLWTERPRSAAAAVGRLERAIGNLSSFAEVQRMPLIVFDDELSRSPAGLMNVFHQVNPISP